MVVPNARCGLARCFSDACRGSFDPKNQMDCGTFGGVVGENGDFSPATLGAVRRDVESNRCVQAEYSWAAVTRLARTSRLRLDQRSLPSMQRDSYASAAGYSG